MVDRPQDNLKKQEKKGSSTSPSIQAPLSVEQIEELRQLYDGAPCGYHSLDTDGVFIRVNQTELTMLGYSQDEMIGKKFSDFLTPESNVTFVENFPQFKKRGWVRDLEFQALRKDGSILPVSVSATAIFDETGSYVMSRSVMIDISDRKQVEAALLECDLFTQKIAQTVPYLLTVYDLVENQIVYSNRSLSQMLGYTVEETTQMGERWWSTIGHPDEPDILAERWQRVENLGSSEVREFEHRRRHANGDWRWHQVRYTAFAQDETGQVTQVLSSVEDITARKTTQTQLTLTESRLRYLLTENPAVLYACEATGDYPVTFISDNITAMLGYESRNFLEDAQFWAKHIHPEDAPRVFEQLAHLFEFGSHTHDYRFLHQDGSYRWVHDEVRLIRDKTGNPLELVGYWTDITEKKQLEAQFLRSQRLESLGTLASGIAHDLNNILTPIIGVVQLLPLKVTQLDDQTQRLLQILNESSRRGADLVKQILSFTRGIEGKPTDTQVRHLLAELQKVIRETFPKNLICLMSLPQDLWLVSADATLLHQVFMNLCVNARDAMPHGGELSISAENLVIDSHYARFHPDAKEGSYVVITIADTGEGIPPDVLEHIYDPFFSTKEVGKGTGLGLSTVLGIVKSHHGFVNVYSEVGQGTRFKVYLPAAEAGETAPVEETHLTVGHGELILVVDDERPIQELTQLTLESHGYRVITASDGVEAIALYAERKQDISVVLLDLMMPSLDSVTTIRTLCRLNPHVQIIAMSGLATHESVIKTMSEGVQAFLPKPFGTPELLTLLARFCA